MRKLFLLLAIALYISNNLFGSIIKSDSTKIDTSKTIKNGSVNILNKASTPEKQKDSVITIISSTPLHSSDSLKFDKIIRKNGEIISCKVVNTNIYEIEYTLFGETISKKINKENVKEIRYASGKVENLVDSPEKRQKDWAVTSTVQDWSKIKVAKDASEVSGLTDKGNIDSEFEANRINTDDGTLERTAIVVLKKKAYALNATTILILTKDFTREYGEMPGVKITAKAYGGN
jgi:hypothetical protein